jgi:hypothetical protein
MAASANRQNLNRQVFVLASIPFGVPIDLGVILEAAK